MNPLVFRLMAVLFEMYKNLPKRWKTPPARLAGYESKATHSVLNLSPRDPVVSAAQSLNHRKW